MEDSRSRKCAIDDQINDHSIVARQDRLGLANAVLELRRSLQQAGRPGLRAQAAKAIWSRTSSCLRHPLLPRWGSVLVRLGVVLRTSRLGSNHDQPLR